jgi:hypothetical protein
MDEAPEQTYGVPFYLRPEAGPSQELQNNAYYTFVKNSLVIQFQL